MIKNWNKIYVDSAQTGKTLSQAREQKLMYYQRECPKHGPTVYAVLDQSCRMCTREGAVRRRNENKQIHRTRELYHERKRRAAEKNITFEITLEDIRNEFPKECPALQIPLSFDSNLDTSPSIDKLDNNIGYTKENTRIISTRANRIKSDGTAEEHFKIGIWQLREQGLTNRAIINYFVGRV